MPSSALHTFVDPDLYFCRDPKLADCQDYLRMSPKRYLWLRRMHLVRQALRIADAEKTTVTEIATDYGFWELGRFAAAYRSLFGEVPSAALRRPPEAPKPVEITEPAWKFVKLAVAA